MVKDGYFYGLGLFLVAAVVQLLTHSFAWALIPILLALFFLWFFRNPRRAIPQGEGLVVSPADGKLTAIDRVTTPDGERFRLSIFLSVVDVHVNRSPVAGTLRDIQYHKGLYLNALNPESATRNERNQVSIECDEGYHVSFSQIAGLLARRIVFNPRVGDRVERGQLVGLIKFGSRVDVILPVNAVLRVAKGERVKGGSSILAEIPGPAETPTPTDEMVETFA
jgi:phosphatidylserine decarboxylase